LKDDELLKINSKKLETQQFIDQAYPPTMTFDVDTLEPTKVLRKRVKIIKDNFPTFFSGFRLLDIGCSKGWFSLSSKHRFRRINAIDSDAKNIELCKHFNSKVDFQHTSFRNYVGHGQFDKIFVGNVAHHLFMETEGWEWIHKLAALSCGCVLVEGATSTQCKDMKEYVPKELHNQFNKFLPKMYEHFNLIAKVPSVVYTPNRYLMFFKKKQVPKYDIYKLPEMKIIRVKDFKTYMTKLKFWKKVVAKVCMNKQSIWRDMNRIRIASCSPVSNGMIGEIYRGKVCVGWLENYSRRKKYRYFENEKELFKRVCQHNIFLSKLGYVDLDPATINFWKGSNKLFDKSCVFPIKSLIEESAGAFPLLFTQSYNTFSRDVGLQVASAIRTKDPVQVEKTFRELLKLCD